MKQKNFLRLIMAGADAADKPPKSIGLTGGIDKGCQRQQAAA